MKGRAGIVIAILVLAAVLALIFRDQLAQASWQQLAGVAFSLMALMIVAGGAGGRLGPNALRNALIWICVVLGIALAYGVFAPSLPPGFGLR